MKRFSERIGAVQAPNIVQLDSMSDSLRNSIWNCIVELFGTGRSGWGRIAELSARFFFKLPVDDLPEYDFERREWIKERFYAMEWYKVYDYAEFVAEWHQHSQGTQRYSQDEIHSIMNFIFEEELSGYRFVGGELVPLSNPAEVAAIEAALSVTSSTGLAGAHAHIASALQLLGKRPDPDYRNSIKESISAVEAREA